MTVQLGAFVRITLPLGLDVLADTSDRSRGAPIMR
jgi:hypothetical protein